MTIPRAPDRMVPVLSIAGSDPGGGAGIQADLRTFALHGVYGCAAITALTVQDPQSVHEVRPVDAEFVARQMNGVFDALDIRAVKTGMLATGAVVRAVARVLRSAAAPHIVVDPVMRATAGAPLLDDDGLDAMRTALLPVTSVLTPNGAEVAALLGTPPPDTVAAMRAAAAALRRFGPRWVLVTGGHVAAGDACVDVLAGPDGVVELRVPRVPTAGMHGSGCTLSSAIAARLALGETVPDACARAQRFVAAAIAAAENTGHAMAGAVAQDPSTRST